MRSILFPVARQRGKKVLRLVGGIAGEMNVIRFFVAHDLSLDVFARGLSGITNRVGQRWVDVLVIEHVERPTPD